MRKKDAIQETLFGSKLQIFQNRTIIINKSKFLEILVSSPKFSVNFLQDKENITEKKS